MDIDTNFIVARSTDGTLYFAECEPGQTFAKCVDDILTGQVERPVSVLACNPIEGWSRDLTEDAARDVAFRLRSRGFASDDLLAFIERAAGVDLVNEVRATILEQVA